MTVSLVSFLRNFYFILNYRKHSVVLTHPKLKSLVFCDTYFLVCFFINLEVISAYMTCSQTKMIIFQNEINVFPAQIGFILSYPHLICWCRYLSSSWLKIRDLGIISSFLFFHPFHITIEEKWNNVFTFGNSWNCTLLSILFLHHPSLYFPNYIL